MFKKIGSWLVKLGLPFIEKQGKAAFVNLLQDMHDAHPTEYKQALVGLYPVIDVQLEDYVKSTPSKVDDRVVADLKAALEESAAANSITLPNLDEGKPND